MNVKKKKKKKGCDMKNMVSSLLGYTNETQQKL